MEVQQAVAVTLQSFPFASRVILRALSEYDYEIVSSQASVVERTLLRSHPHLAVGQRLAIEISKSLVATVVVASIEAGDGAISEARISRDTEIVVHPYDDEERVAAAGAAGARNPQGSAVVCWIDAISKLSSMYPLRVLPSDVRLHMTSSSSSGEDVLDDLESMCGDGAGVVVSGDGARSLLRDDCTCYAHPSFARTLCALAQCSAPPEQPGDPCFLAALTPCEDGGAKGTHLVVRVALRECVPRHHVLLPADMRRAIGAGDYDSVRLSVLPSARQAGCSLLAKGVQVVLSPLQRHSRLDHRSLLEQALMRVRSKNSPGPLLLTSGQTLHVVSGARRGRGQETRVALVAETQTLAVSYRLQILQDGAGPEEPAFVAVPADDDALFQALLLRMVVVHSDALIDGAQAAAGLGGVERAAPGERQPVLFEELVRAVAVDVCAAVLPLAALDGCALGVAPPLGAFLLAPARAGKTAVMRTIAGVCAVCPQTLTQAVWIDLDALKHRPVRAIMEALSERFDEAAKRPPSLLLIDNIDVVVCADGGGGGSAGAGNGLSALQRHLLRTHLLRLLRQLQRSLLETFHSLRESIARSSSSEERSVLLRDFYDSYESRAVYVLASCSGPVDAAFAAACPFKTLFRVPRLDAALRLRFLERVMRLSGDEQSRVQLADATASAATVGELVAMVRSSLSSVVEQRLAAGAGPLAMDASALSHMQLEALLFAGRAAGAENGAAGSWGGVLGLARAKEQVRDVIHLPIVFNRLYRQSPMQLPRALLLYGPPGCGKTWLANAAGAMMNELQFVSVRGAQLLQKYVGASEKAVRDLFDGARTSGKPTLIFFDEIEALAPRRGKDSTGVTDRVVNQLLTCIDGIDAADGSSEGDFSQVYLIAASSRPDMIDPALLRPGRIQVHVYVGMPSAEERRELLQSAIDALLCGGGERADVQGAVERILGHPLAERLTRVDLQAVVGLAHMDGVTRAVEEGLGAAELSGEALWQGFLRVAAGLADCDALLAGYREFGRAGAGVGAAPSMNPLTSPAKQILK